MGGLSGGDGHPGGYQGVTKKPKMQYTEDGRQIRGFLRMKLEDPKRLAEVCARAGRVRVKKKKGHLWSKKEAKLMASKGGRARWGVKKFKPNE